MPREPLPLVREGGFREAEKMYVLSYEGTVTEINYFEDFRSSKYFNNSGIIEVISLERPKGRGTDPFSVKKLLSEAKKDFNFKKTDEFWLVFDRDHWETKHGHDFEKLANDCEKETNFYLAMSNPCFEFWLLLHLKSLKDFSSEDIQKIYANERVSSRKNYLDWLLGEIQGRGYNKKPDAKLFLPKIGLAIERAKELDIDGDRYPKKLGTHVYKLMQKLIIK